METNSFIISEQESQERLDKVLTSRFEGHSRSYFQYLIENGSVLSDGKNVKKREKAKAGSEISVDFLLSPEIKLTPEDIPLDILYEDSDLIAINKPPGMVTHPAPGHPNKTFVNALLHHCKSLEISEGCLRPGIVHRLDKDTSGVLIAAKTTRMHRLLIELFEKREMHKVYHAVTVGNPGDKTLEMPIGRHPKRRKEMSVMDDGRAATTHLKTLKVENNLSYVEVHPITGRTHQIRVHLKACKTPVLGDPIYGASKCAVSQKQDRLFLHAYNLIFTHPISGKELNIKAPLPEEFTRLFPTLIVE